MHQQPQPARLSWFRRLVVVVGYCIAQYAIMFIGIRLPWTEGRDVFGPYPHIPDPVVLIYCIQFVALPFLPWRYRAILLLEYAVMLGIYLIPNWDVSSNVFAPDIMVPDRIWNVYWTQALLVPLCAIATDVIMWRIKSRTGEESR